VSRGVAAQHNDWLTLVEPVGAFLTLPVLQRALPNGVPPVDRDLRAECRLRLDALTSDVSARTGWLHWLLHDLLALGPRLREGVAVPAGLTHHVPEHGAILRPDFAIVDADEAGPAKARLLGFRWPLGTRLDARPIDPEGRSRGWAAAPIERAAVACRAADVPLALVTDTHRLALVWAPRNEPGGHAVFTSSLFGEERVLLDALVALLQLGRFFGVAESETLEALFRESAAAQSEVTDRLGHQVREAVELLIGAFSRAQRASGGGVLRGVSPAQVYESAVTVMMRLVVLLSAEERRLLPIDDPLYLESYSIAALRDQLEDVARRDGPDTLEKRHTAWHRVLATCRAVHGGVQHERLHLTAYGGSLFDPSRFPFLEGEGQPIPVDDHTMHAVLSALQVLTFRLGGITEARRLSYRNLDVEQIGHVYEGLLDHGCRPVSDGVVLCLKGQRGVEPELVLFDLEVALRQGDEAFAAWLSERGGPSATKTKALLYGEPEAQDYQRLMAACDNDDQVYRRVRPFWQLLRTDLRGLPMVVLPGGLYVTKTSDRRDSGTAYTTKELADEVVRYALEPLVYAPGPREGTPPDEWRLRTSMELLALKVCDPAVGSGAILVAACRYLADRVVEAWQAEGIDLRDEDDTTLRARRAVVDHCLYGVDRNPMAVEMARLSLWLTTLAKDRPFTFLDHQVRSGDALLGIRSLDQVRWLHIDPARGKELHSATLFKPGRDLEPRVAEALHAMRALEAIDVIDVRDVEAKGRLHARMVSALAPLATIADTVVGAALLGGETDTVLTGEVVPAVERAFGPAVDDRTRARALADLAQRAAYWLDTDRPDSAPERVCLHWPLAFPEVFLAEGRSGFDAFVGNPPFVGGQYISGTTGSSFRSYLVAHIAHGHRGSADLVAYFYLRAFSLLREEGMTALLATKTIAQGATRRVGLEQLLAASGCITRAVPSTPWPGSEALEIAKVWIHKGKWLGRRYLAGAAVPEIDSSFSAGTRAAGTPHKLKANEHKSFQGSIVLGMGFVVSPEEAQALIARAPRNGDVLFPYLNGEDLNSRPDQSPSRWVINFRDWPLERSAGGTWERAETRQRMEMLRTGRVPADYPHAVAADYPDCLDIVVTKVKPERDSNPRAPRRERWWQFAERAPLLYSTIADREHVLACSEVTKHLVFALVPKGLIYSSNLDVFPLEDFREVGALQSSVHEVWARVRSSYLADRLKYSPGNAFQTFPFPNNLTGLGEVGREYFSHRETACRSHILSFTRLYNRFHDKTCAGVDITRLRELHVELDRAVADAYGWNDLALGHDFHDTRQGVRFTVSPAARQEILDRLLELNHQRYAEEVAQGLHAVSGGSRKTQKNRTATQTKAGGKKPASSDRSPLMSFAEADDGG
jgi:hypothetical protein